VEALCCCVGVGVTGSGTPALGWWHGAGRATRRLSLTGPAILVASRVRGVDCGTTFSFFSVKASWRQYGTNPGQVSRVRGREGGCVRVGGRGQHPTGTRRGSPLPVECRCIVYVVHMYAYNGCIYIIYVLYIIYMYTLYST